VLVFNCISQPARLNPFLEYKKKQFQNSFLTLGIYSDQVIPSSHFKSLRDKILRKTISEMKKQKDNDGVRQRREKKEKNSSLRRSSQ